MNHKLKRKWVASLRGGTYKQCAFAYEIGDARCALGVLHEVAPECKSRGEYCSGISKEHANYIVVMNDHEYRTFPEIADWIEANVPES